MLAAGHPVDGRWGKSRRGIACLPRREILHPTTELQSRRRIVDRNSLFSTLLEFDPVCFSNSFAINRLISVGDKFEVAMDGSKLVPFAVLSGVAPLCFVLA